MTILFQDRSKPQLSKPRGSEISIGTGIRVVELSSPQIQASQARLTVPHSSQGMGLVEVSYSLTCTVDDPVSLSFMKFNYY
ncbi:hypothetical protein FGO68_gene7960 [Halteria grandinella]|uniref:Uncharacterized protein n=1 Tax=Halteria grandinella TaxID=5974 RepID=A0A8J8T3T0_HALGN|nr:hypothetical protein FGO68_gene7960 [Halteria grandinella]